MRIWLQSFGIMEDMPEYAKRIELYCRRIKRPDTEIHFSGLDPKTYPARYPPDDLAYSFLFHAHSIQWVKYARLAEKSGFDAFGMCTFADPLAREIGTIIDIPVVPAVETCFHLASMLGRRFGVLSFADRLIPLQRDLLREAGLEDRCVGIVPSGITYDDIMKGYATSPGALVDKIRKASEPLVSAGADVIIPGEGPLNLLLASEGVRRIGEIPLMDIYGSVLKMSEVFAEFRAMGIYHSRHGWHNAAPERGRVDEIINYYFRA